MEGAINVPILAFLYLEWYQWILVAILIALIIFLKIYRSRQS